MNAYHLLIDRQVVFCDTCKQRLNKRGYYLTEIQINKKSTTFEVHRLIAKAFFNGIPKDMEIDHIDRVRSNNKITNLRVVTKSENLKNRDFRGRPTIEVIEKIIKLHKKGLSTEQIKNCF